MPTLITSFGNRFSLLDKIVIVRCTVFQFWTDYTLRAREPRLSGYHRAQEGTVKRAFVGQSKEGRKGLIASSGSYQLKKTLGSAANARSPQSKGMGNQCLNIALWMNTFPINTISSIRSLDISPLIKHIMIIIFAFSNHLTHYTRGHIVQNISYSQNFLNIFQNSQLLIIS